MPDYYGQLGLQRGAALDEVKAAFRKLALKHHPDRHAQATPQQQSEASARFKAITEAYEVLTDDRKRSQYDASARSGGAYAGRGAGAAGAGEHTYDGQYYTRANTDWAYSRYSHSNDARYRVSWFQQAQRLLGVRKLEVAVALGLVGLAVFGGPAVDAAWAARNHGRRFSDMQAAAAAQARQAPAAGGAAGSGGALGELSGRSKPYSSPAGCGTGSSRAGRVFPGHHHPPGSGPTEAQLASMSLSDLIALEERAAAGQEQQQPATTTATGDASARPGGGPAAGRGGGSSSSSISRGWVDPQTGRDVDRASVVPQPSPPGFMGGHR